MEELYGVNRVTMGLLPTSLWQSMSGQLIPEDTDESAGPPNPNGQQNPNGQTRPNGQTNVTRETSSTNNRTEFRRSQRQVVLQVINRNLILLLIVFILLPGAYSAVGLALFLQGWSVLTSSGDRTCDEPLNIWLLMNLCRISFFLLEIPIRRLINKICSSQSCPELPRKHLSACNSLLRLVLFFRGASWMAVSQTCATTNPDLYEFVKIYLLFQLVSIVLLDLALPYALISLLTYGLMHGWFDTQVHGADPNTIEKIETVPYDAAHFAEEGVAYDDRPPGECCICMEPFCQEKGIKRTPCEHHFHEACLDEWLKRSKKCPLCRIDLEESVNQAGGTNQASV